MEKLKIRLADFFGTLVLKIMLNIEDIIDTIVTAVVTIVVVLVLTNFFFMPVKVIGTSMMNNLQDNSFGFSSIISRRISGIDRFDIVVIHLDEQNENLVKRVVGLPGETVWYVNDTLYVDGTPIEETFLDPVFKAEQIKTYHKLYFTEDTAVYTLGDDEYLCLGDNRVVSLDSRVYGPFSGDQIKSVGIFVIKPFSDFGNQ